MKYIIPTVLIFLLSLTFVFGEEANEPVLNIISINFTGNENVNDESLASVITTKVGDPWDIAKVQQDINSIAAMGLFSAITYKKEEKAGGIALTFDLIENPRINKIILSNVEPLKEDEILSILKTKEGLLFNENTVREDFKSIRELYASKGYLAYVTEEADIDPDSGTLTIPIMVYKIGKITVSGNKKTKENVILREMTLKKGDYYNVITLRNVDYPKIYDLGFFETINDPEPEEGEEGFININIPVVEKNTGSFNIGLGYSSTKKLVGTIRVGDTNFLGTGKSVSAYWEQSTQTGFNGKYSWEISYGDPWIDNKNTHMNVSVYNKLVYRFTDGSFGGNSLNTSTNYGERHKGATLSFSRPFGPKKITSAKIGFTYDNVETNPNLLIEKDMWRIIQNGVVTSINATLDHDTRDLKTNAKEGSYKSITGEVGHIDGNQFSPSEFDSTYYKEELKGEYWKISADVRYYKATRKRSEQEFISSKDLRPSFALRGRAGISGGELPFFQQFFLGGGDSLRGYDDDRFWGKYLAVATLEYKYPIFDYLTMVAFADFGDAWGNKKFLNFKQLKQTENFEGHLGVGIGARFNTPLGAMRLDWGFGEKKNKLHFSMGQTF